MPTYLEWTEELFRVDNLRLDKENPRLPIYVRGKRSDKIRDYLVRFEDVDEIAKLIAKDGFNKFMPIYAIKLGKSTVVIEGNRRTCAMQLLRNPDMAPAEKQSFYKRLSMDINVDEFKKVRIAVAPSRRDARRTLYSEHARDAKKRWSRQQKNRFIADELISGKTIGEISKDLKVNPTEIKEAATEILLQVLFEEIDMPADNLKKALSEKFPLSTLTRVLNSKTFKKILNMRIENSALVVDVSEAMFKDVIRKIIIDLSTPIKQGGHNSRTLNTEKQIDDYSELILGSFSDADKNDKFEYSPKKSAIKKIDANAYSEESNREKRKIIYLVPSHINTPTGLTKLDHIIAQGKKMQTQIFPIAGAFLLRAILELSVARIYELYGCKDEAFNNEGRILNLTPLLKKMVKKQTWFKMDQERLDLERFCSSDSPQYLHVETLNRYVHGHFDTPDVTTLSSFWTSIEPLVRMCCELTEQEEGRYSVE